MNEEKTFHWKTPEYIPKEKSADWYWAIGIIAVASASAAFILNNLLLGILILIAAFTLMLYAARNPRVISIKIIDKGVKIDNKYYPFENLETFWVEDRKEEPTLFLKSQKTLMPIISVLIRDVNPEELRDFLGEFLKEEEMDEGLSQSIMEFFGF